MSKNKKKITATAVMDTFLKQTTQHSSVEGNVVLKVDKGQKITFSPKKEAEDNHLEIRYIKVDKNDKIIPVAYMWKKAWEIEK